MKIKNEKDFDNFLNSTANDAGGPGELGARASLLL